jgi:hypothetical protein
MLAVAVENFLSAMERGESGKRLVAEFSGGEAGKRFWRDNKVCGDGGSSDWPLPGWPGAAPLVRSWRAASA